LIGERDGDLDISPAHLEGKIVGTQGGTIHERYLKKHYIGNKVKIYQTQDEAFQDLSAGRVDYVQGDMIPLLDFLGTSVGKTCCELKGELPDDPKILGIGAAGGIRKGDVALKNKLNAALKFVRESGEYETISRKYFTFDIAP
jgi:polar amino acid transport system substrate-binding protein